MSLHVYRSGAWGAICDISNTIHAYKGGIPNLVKTIDWIWNGSGWQQVCPVLPTIYSLGFDLDNETITPIGGGSERREVAFKFEPGYDWAAFEALYGKLRVEFTMTIDIPVGGSCYINMYDDFLNYYTPRIDLLSSGEHEEIREIEFGFNPKSTMRYLIQASPNVVFHVDTFITNGNHAQIDLGGFPYTDVYDFTI